MEKNFLNKFLILLIVLLLLANFSCKKGKNEENDSIVTPEFFTSEVIVKELTGEISGLGSISFYEKATVLGLVEGNVEKIYVKKGEKVAKGQLLMDLSNYELEIEKVKVENQIISAQDEIEQIKLQLADEEKSVVKQFHSLEKLLLELQKSEAELNFLKESFEKKKQLYEKGGMTEEEFINMKFNIEQKEREYEIAKKEYELSSYGFRDEDITNEGFKIPDNFEEKIKIIVLINTKLTRQKLKAAQNQLKSIYLEQKRIDWLLDKCHVRSPINGVVTDISKFVGEKVKADDELTTIIDLTYLYAKVSFSENDLEKIKKNTEVKVYIDSIDKTIKGSIHTIDPYIDPASRTFSVDCMIKNPGNLLPGMFIKVYIPAVKKTSAILAPVEAVIVESENKGYVFIVSKDERVFKKEIVFEKYDDKYYTITTGLNEREIVVLNPVINIKDGTKIKVLTNSQ